MTIAQAGTHDQADPELYREIRAIPAVDDHAHPLTLGLDVDGDRDNPIQPYDYPLPLRLRPTNPEYLDAWAALWGYEFRDFETRHLADLMDAKRELRSAQGPDYNSWVLDRLNIETMISISPEPDATQPPPRFRWCAHVDWLLWPFASDPAPSPAQDWYLAMAARQRTIGQLDEQPGTLDAFVDDLLLPSLQRSVERGAVAVKFNTPYYRSLYFSNPTLEEMRSAYARGARTGALPPAEHRTVQDYIFRLLVTEAGRLGLPVQMHTGLGVLPRFQTAGSNPILMEPVFREIPGTDFLLLHGGWPFDREATSLLAHENVYVDYSCASIYFYARKLGALMRDALEWFPEKVLYGTDAYPDQSIAKLSGVPLRPNPLAGWEEKAWLMDRVGRQALALALTGMHADDEIDSERASVLAEMVMRRNATSLYKL